MSSSNIGDIVLDPFFGTGTTGAVKKFVEFYWNRKDAKIHRLKKELIK